MRRALTIAVMHSSTSSAESASTFAYLTAPGFP
jgi:hypothetical protein